MSYTGWKQKMSKPVDLARIHCSVAFSMPVEMGWAVFIGELRRQLQVVKNVFLLSFPRCY